MVVEHGEVDKFLEQEENVTEQLTDPNQVKSVLIIIAQMLESKLIIQGVFFNWPPPKSFKYKKVTLG